MQFSVVKHIWQYNEVISLIRSMETHYEDLAHPRKRKSVFINVMNDLLSHGIAVDENMCQAKWKNLVRSYNTAKDQKTRTGRGPSRFQFFCEMDDLLGEKPTNKTKHSMESSSSNHMTEEVNIDQRSLSPELEEVNSNSGVQNYEVADNNTNTDNKEKGKKRKWNVRNTDVLKEINAEKSKRHKERMEIERKKLEMEERKCKLLETYLENR